MGGHPLQDTLRGNAPLSRPRVPGVQQIGDRFRGDRDIHYPVVSQYLAQYSLQVPDVALDPLGDQLNYSVCQLNPQLGRLEAQNRHPGLQVRRLDVRYEAPFETGAHPVLQKHQFPRGPVRGDYHLPPGCMQVVEGVKKPLVGLFLTAQELDVIQ